MSEQRLNLVPNPELVRLMISLEGNEDFKALMKYMKDRADGLAMWACLVENEVNMRWAQGRVSEMIDWLRAWEQRREAKSFFETQEKVAEYGGDGILS